MFGETHAYDQADRHLQTTKGTTTVRYVRDAADRIIERKLNGTTVARYGYTATGDISALTLNSTGTVLDVTIGLPGGALQTITGATSSWGYPNIHGDLVAIANAAGVKQGTTVTYDPYGNLAAGTLPNNSTGNLDYAWEGQHQRPLEHETGLQPIIEMGARQYSTLLGRFLEVDPIEGGSANNYDYANGEPINQFDLAGTCSTHNKGFGARLRNARCRASRAAGAAGRAISGAAKVTGRALSHAASAGAGVVDRNRWTLAGFGVGAICIGTGGLGCGLAATSLFAAKSISTYRGGGGWRSYAANAISSYAFALPGAGLTGVYNTAAWRALAEAFGLGCSALTSCASPAHL